VDNCKKDIDLLLFDLVCPGDGGLCSLLLDSHGCCSATQLDSLLDLPYATVPLPHVFHRVVSNKRVSVDMIVRLCILREDGDETYPAPVASVTLGTFTAGTIPSVMFVA
jgi:hypothetical protein